MKKMRASVSPSLFLRGRMPVVTAYLSTRPASRSSCRVVTGFSSSSFFSFAFSASAAGDGEGDGDGLGVAACNSRNETKDKIMNAPFLETAGTLSRRESRRQDRATAVYSSWMRRTKIVATIGPASRDAATLERLMDAGADVLRLNFSHGDHPGHLEVINTARAIAQRKGKAIALLQDLSGPKIRTGRVRD